MLIVFMEYCFVRFKYFHECIMNLLEEEFIIHIPTCKYHFILSTTMLEVTLQSFKKHTIVLDLWKEDITGFYFCIDLLTALCGLNSLS